MSSRKSSASAICTLPGSSALQSLKEDQRRDLSEPLVKLTGSHQAPRAAELSQLSGGGAARPSASSLLMESSGVGAVALVVLLTVKGAWVSRALPSRSSTETSG